MKRKSPISVSSIQFYTYGIEESVSFDQFPYDDRNDFIADRLLSGIAVKIGFHRDRYGKGVRRDVSLRLVDVTDRYEVASENTKVIIGKNEFFKEIYVQFPSETSRIFPGHTYRLIVCDDTSSQTLSGKIFHLLDKNSLPHPTEWYEILDGGLRPPGENDLYKTIKTADGQIYYVRFNLAHKFGPMPPAVFPELELRLYYPDGRHIEAHFREPECHGAENYRNNIWSVEYPFTTSDDVNGVFYAELLCMEYPVAGFAFDNNVDDERGKWDGRYIEPLDEYTPEAAIERWSGSPARSDECAIAEAEDFDRLLDRFIAKEMAECGCPSDDERSEASADESHDSQSPDTDTTNESFLSSLDHLTGLQAVKEKLTVYERVVRFNKMRSDKGLPSASTPLHAMFLGSPGTGKTTVAKMMGIMLHRAGVLSKGHVVVRERATLLGQNYNSEAEKTLAAIEEAQGGILLIDEAYQLCQPNDPRDPGKFVIETLLSVLADENIRDWMLVLAGYPDEMKRMFEMNPGLKSRIPDSNIYLFDDFTESELIEIAEKYLSRHQYTLSDKAQIALSDRLRKDYTNRQKNFGNARHVINMIQTEIIPSMAVRVTNYTAIDENSLTEIKAEDIPSPVGSRPAPSRPRVGFIQ